MSVVMSAEMSGRSLEKRTLFCLLVSQVFGLRFGSSQKVELKLRFTQSVTEDAD